MRPLAASSAGRRSGDRPSLLGTPYRLALVAACPLCPGWRLGCVPSVASVAAAVVAVVTRSLLSLGAGLAAGFLAGYLVYPVVELYLDFDTQEVRWG